MRSRYPATQCTHTHITQHVQSWRMLSPSDLDTHKLSSILIHLLSQTRGGKKEKVVLCFMYTHTCCLMQRMRQQPLPKYLHLLLHIVMRSPHFLFSTPVTLNQLLYFDCILLVMHSLSCNSYYDSTLDHNRSSCLPRLMALFLYLKFNYSHPFKEFDCIMNL